MAIPYAAIMAGISLVQGITAKRNAEKIAAYQKELAERNRLLAQQQATRQIGQLGAVLLQEQSATAQRSEAIGLEAMAAKATATVGAAESGTEGASVAALNADFARQQAMAQTTLVRNQEFRKRSADVQASSIRDGMDASIINSLPPPVVIPTFMGAALRATEAYIGASDKFGATPTTSDTTKGVSLTSQEAQGAPTS